MAPERFPDLAMDSIGHQTSSIIHHYQQNYIEALLMMLRLSGGILRKCLPFPSQKATPRWSSSQVTTTRPAQLPKPILDLKHIRENPGLYETNCLQRKYPHLAKNSWRVLELTEHWKTLSKVIQDVRSRRKQISKEMGALAGAKDIRNADAERLRAALIEEGQKLAEVLEKEEKSILDMQAEIDELAVQLPNLSLTTVPLGEEPEVLEEINMDKVPNHFKSHVDIGTELGLLDLASASPTSGRGFYFLTGAGVLLEQALVQHALKTAQSAGFSPVVPPSLVYGYLSSACGFQPRDQDGRQQVFTVEGSNTSPDASPQLVLAGTSEIPLAGMFAGTTFQEANFKFPMRKVGISRCFRAEAGARGRDTKGLYRVHEFTKVELFSWVLPPKTNDQRFSAADEDRNLGQTELKLMLDLQKRILEPLGLPLRVQNQPTTDLGASAACKIDIETFFPSRQELASPWGELSSLSLCTDYQTRRLHTRVKMMSGTGKEPGLVFPYTLNGTALAVPRVMAALLENGWDDSKGVVRLPECLWDAMGTQELNKGD